MMEEKTIRPYSTPTVLFDMDEVDVICTSIVFGESPIDLPEIDLLP